MKKLAATILLMGAMFTGVFAQTSQKVKTSTTPTTHHAPKSTSTVYTKDETKNTIPAGSQEAVAVKHKHKHTTTKKEGKK